VSVDQGRLLKTEIPGSLSREWLERKLAAVSAGVDDPAGVWREDDLCGAARRRVAIMRPRLAATS
jgi:hypothetical protein